MQQFHFDFHSFLFQPNFHFPASGFFHMRHFDIDFLTIFLIYFFRNGFPNSLIVRSRSGFLFSLWKFFELYVRTCPAMFFISPSRFLLRPYDVTTTSNLLFNCSWTKFIAIIVNVCVFFMEIFRLTILTFRVTFTPLALRFAWPNILSRSQFQAAELNWRQFNTKSQMKSAPKLVPFFFILNLNSGICWPLMWLFEAHYWTS